MGESAGGKRIAKGIKMGGLRNMSFIVRVVLSMAFALLINLAYGLWLFSSLSGKSYVLEVEATSTGGGTLELFWDSGSGFKEARKVVLPAVRGRNAYTFPFQVNTDERLKLLRFDFGPVAYEGGIQIHSFDLKTGDRNLFHLTGDKFSSQIIYAPGIFHERGGGMITVDHTMKPFDPYLILSPVNELVLPVWARICLLLFPCLIFFAGPAYRWMRSVFQSKDYVLPLIAFFIISVSLKPAWVTFTSLLILAYAIARLAERRRFRFSKGALAILLLFIIPLVMLGDGRASKLSIPLGFVWFPIVVCCIDLDGKRKEIQLIYTRVFFIMMALTLVSWMILVLQEGYFYGITISNYFTDIKSTAHQVLFWIYYPHTTFLSFFVLTGALFCLDMYRNSPANRNFSIMYWLFSCVFMLVLGSRIGLVMAGLLPLLAIFPIRHLKVVLLPLWLVLFGVVWYLIGELDPLRARLWELSLESIGKHLWFGHGTGSSEVILPEKLYLADGDRDIWMPVNHSHNQFLTYLLENGVIGLTAVGISLAILWRELGRRGIKSVLLFFFFLLLLMTVESPFRTTNALYIISFILALYSAPSAFSKPPSGPREEY